MILLTQHVTLQEAAASAGSVQWTQVPQVQPALLTPVRAAPTRPSLAGGSAVRRSISDIPPARLEPHHVEGRASDLSCKPALADRIQQLERQAYRWALLLQVLCGVRCLFFKTHCCEPSAASGASSSLHINSLADALSMTYQRLPV